MKFTDQHKNVAIVSVMALFFMQLGCSDGFEPVQTKAGQDVSVGGVLPAGSASVNAPVGVTPVVGTTASSDAVLEEIVITAKPLVTPRIQSLANAAKDSKVHFENIGEKDADVILSTEVESLKANVIKVKSLINISGRVSLISGEVALTDKLDGQASEIMMDFDKDFEEIGQMQNVNGAQLAQQTILYCENKCAELTVHVQLTDADKKVGAAFYHYKKNEKNEYTLVNSSVDSRYQTISQAVETVKASQNDMQQNASLKVPLRTQDIKP